MKILLLTQVFPYPLDSGPKVKTYHVLRHLAEEHEVTLLSYVRDLPLDSIEHIKGFCQDVHTVQIHRAWWYDLIGLIKSLILAKPFLMLRDRRKAMFDEIQHVCAHQNFDVIHVDQLNMAQFVEHLDSKKKILDAHNALWLLYKRLSKSTRLSLRKLVLEREWRLLRRYERDFAKSFDVVLTVSEEDRRAFLDIDIPANKVVVIPISIDARGTRQISRDPGARNVLHVGTMFWPPNSEGVMWFLSEVWPSIHQANSEVEFDIIGARPPIVLKQKAAHSANVNVHGYVRDTGPYIQRGGVMVVPLHAGGGMRVKILNALAQGIPIVSTSIGCEGIRVEHGKHILIADTPSDFAHAVCRVLDDKDLAIELVRNGRTLVEECYDYRTTLKRMDEQYAKFSRNGREVRV